MNGFTLEEVTERSLRNLRKMSRTANGIVDVSASATKKDVMLLKSGEEAAEKASDNFIRALNYCYGERNRVFTDVSELRSFVEKVGAEINRGIVKEGQLIRSGEDSKKYNYTRLQYMEEELHWFYERLLELLSRPDPDPVYLGAFMEYYVNLRIHMFGDGCGKSSIALSAYMFMRSGTLPVCYDSRDQYYSHGTTGIFRCGSEGDRKDFENFLAYYSSLPGGEDPLR